jgi:hypothetical protein
MSENRVPFCRQGDVLLVRVDSLPEGAVKQEGPVILAYGEATGHEHRIDTPGATLYTLEVSGETKTFLTADQLLELAHKKGGTYTEEHKSLFVEPGVYEVMGQNQWSDEREPVQRVLD